MTGPKAWAAQARGIGAYLKRVEAARALDPEAFKPFYVPRFTDEQLRRQQLALEKVNAGPTTPP